MSVLKRILVVVFALAILVSTTGVSLVTHSCNMAGISSTRLFPEFFGKKVSCCCLAVADPYDSHTNLLKKTGCCIDVYSLIKIPSFFNYHFSNFFPVKVFIDIPFRLNFDLIAPEFFSQDGFSHYWPPPPLHYGKILLHFIHQIKVHLLY